MSPKYEGIMNLETDPVLMFQAPEVKTYFLEILSSDLSPGDKYEAFIEFLRLGRKVREHISLSERRLLEGKEPDVQRIVSSAAEAAGIWKPADLLVETGESIKRALRRLKASQHDNDHAWGQMPGQSAAWETAFAVFCLKSAKSVNELAVDIDGNSLDKLLEGGIDWLKEHSNEWSVDTGRGNSVYQVSLGIRCFYHVEQSSFPPVSESLDQLAKSQNRDGGWDAQIWGPYCAGLRNVYSEVGATSNALRALALSRRETVGESIRRGVQWLVGTQNSEASWNNGSCRPNQTTVDGQPSVTKTCDGIKGLLVGKHCNVSVTELEQRINKAVEWVLSMEKPILDKNMTISGWGWTSSELSALENTALTLETLVGIHGVSLPILAANAQWLMNQQFRENGHIEDGAWPCEHTARVANGLIEFYKIIAESSAV